MKNQFNHGLSMILALAMIIGLLSGLTITANAADDTALREAIAKNANTYCSTAAVRNDGMVIFDNTMERYMIKGFANVASIANPVEYSEPVAVSWDGSVLTRSSHPWHDVVSSWENIVSVHELWFRGYELVALRLDGTVISTDPDSIYNTWTNVETLQQSKWDSSYVVGITKDGKVLCPYFDVSSWRNVVQVDCSSNMIVGVRNDGTVLYADQNGSKVMTGWTNVVQVACQSDVLALRKDGTVLTTADPKYSADLATWTDIVRIDNNWYQYAGLKADGSVVVAGDIDLEVGAPKSSQFRDLVDVKISGGALVGLRSDGKVVEWSYGETKTLFSNVTLPASAFTGKPSNADLIPFGNEIAYPKETSYLNSYETKCVKPPKGNSIYVFWNANGPLATSKRPFYLYEGDIVTVLAREKTRSCVICTDQNGNKQVGWVSTNYLENVKPPKTPIVDGQRIVIGRDWVLGLTDEGTVLSAGHVETYELERFAGWVTSGLGTVDSWRDIIAIDAAINGDEKTVLGLKKDGTVVSAGWNFDGECNVSDWTDIIQIEAEVSVSYGLKADGTMVAAGRAKHGACDVESISTGTRMYADEHYVDSVFVLKEDGTVEEAGRKKYSKSDFSTFTDISNLCVNLSEVHGVTKDGKVVSPYFLPAEIVQWTDVEKVFDTHFLLVGLRKDGTLLSYASYNMHGEEEIINTITNWTDIKDIVILSYYSHYEAYTVIGIKNDGSVVSTGGVDLTGFDNIMELYALDDGNTNSIYLVGVRYDGTVVSNNPAVANTVAKWKLF